MTRTSAWPGGRRRRAVGEDLRLRGGAGTDVDEGRGLRRARRHCDAGAQRRRGARRSPGRARLQRVDAGDFREVGGQAAIGHRRRHARQRQARALGVHVDRARRGREVRDAQQAVLGRRLRGSRHRRERTRGGRGGQEGHPQRRRRQHESGRADPPFGPSHPTSPDPRPATGAPEHCIHRSGESDGSIRGGRDESRHAERVCLGLRMGRLPDMTARSWGGAPGWPRKTS